MKRFFIFIMLSALVMGANAKKTTVSGKEPSYAGKTIRLNYYMDEVVGMQRTLDSCVVDTSGAFSFNVDIASPLQVFIPSETYNGFLFLEPGKKYEVTIPPFAERTLAQKLDPYFKPTDIFVQIAGLKQGDFNYKLMEFEDAFDFYSMKHIMYGGTVDSLLKSIDQMKEIFNDLYADQFLGRYMEYRFLLLLNTSSQIYQDSLIARLNVLGADEQNPAFWDVFNNLFDNFIPQTQYDREQYLSFQRIIEEGNAKMYFMLIANRYGIRDQSLKELVAIKWLYDLINQSQFDQFKVMDLLQKIGAGISSQQNRDMLTHVLNHTSINIIGLPAPNFVMKTIEGKKKKLSDFKGKYIYLNFENSVIDQTQKDLDVLLRFQNDYKNDLLILNVGMYDLPESAKKLSQRYSGKMQFMLADNSDEVKELYKIKSIPSFFLIDKDGNFLITKGAEPTDELRMLLQRILKSR